MDPETRIQVELSGGYGDGHIREVKETTTIYEYKAEHGVCRYKKTDRKTKDGFVVFEFYALERK